MKNCEVWNVYGDLHSNVYNSLVETRNYVSRQNSDKGSLNETSCIILFCQNVHTANSKPGFYENTYIEWKMVHFSSVSPLNSMPCRPATQVSKVDPKG